MSTYGKKSMAYWEYEEKKAQEELYRFNSTTHNIQEEILKRWYPIGFTCQQYSKVSKKYYGSYKVIRYTKMA